MNKRIVLASAIMALLMLVSTQIVVMNTVGSDPTPHVGDANVGTFWVTSLITSDSARFGDIGVAHANATNDYVYWQFGAGLLTARWTVSLPPIHPELEICYSMCVYHVDNDNAQIGYDTHIGTYNENTSYEVGGDLTVDVVFTQGDMANGTQTLVCLLSGSVKVNNTEQNKNFTTEAWDRAIVGVTFSNIGPGTPFSQIKDKANDDMPSIFSYLPGWDDYFLGEEAEEKMLDGQTVAISGTVVKCKQYTLGDWKVGEYDCVRYHKGDGAECDISASNVIPQWKITDPEREWAEGSIYIEFDVDNQFPKRYTERALAICRVKLFHDYDNKWAADLTFDYGELKEGEGEHYGPATVLCSEEYRDPQYPNRVPLHGEMWGQAGCFDYDRITEDFDDWYLIINPNGKNEPPEEPVHVWDWQAKCTYMEGSYNVTVSGTSTILIDISEGLEKDNELILTNAADRGDTKIVLTN